MSWYAFHGYNNGKAINASSFDGTELISLGMHGYATAAQAEAHPNSVNVFQAPVVNAAIDDANNARDVASAPGNAAKAAAKAAGISNPLSFLGDIANVLGDLTQASTWIRLAKIVIGGALVIAGVAHLTGASRTITAAAGKIPVVP